MGRFYKCFPAKAFNCREEGPWRGACRKDDEVWRDQ